MNIYDYFLASVDLYGDKIAFICSEKSITYNAFADEVLRLICLFDEAQLNDKMSIALLLDNSIEFAVIMIAAAAKCATVIPLSSSLPISALRASMKASDANFLVADSTFFQKNFKDLPLKKDQCLTVGRSIDGIKNYYDFDRNTEDILYKKNSNDSESDYILTLTSGSTGQPKPIVLSQKAKIERIFRGAKEIYNISDNDTIIIASPMYHSLGIRMTLLPLLIGATGIILKRFHPRTWLEAVRNNRATFTIAVSSHLEILLNYPAFNEFDLSSLRCIVSSSSLLSSNTKRKCIDAFPCEFHECYGTSEIGIATNLGPDDVSSHSGSVGKALPYVDLRIVDDERNGLATGIAGEIICKTETAFSCYYNNPVATEESMIDGYFYTGDLGYLDTQGFLHLCGRKKEMIIVGGTNVYPFDVEEVLRSHKNIKEAAVIGVADEYFGEAVLAILVANGVLDLREVRQLCARELADYQQPMAYEIVDELPRNALGKLMKYKLKERFVGYDATKNIRTLFARK